MAQVPVKKLKHVTLSEYFNSAQTHLSDSPHLAIMEDRIIDEMEKEIDRRSPELEPRPTTFLAFLGDTLSEDEKEEIHSFLAKKYSIPNKIDLAKQLIQKKNRIEQLIKERERLGLKRGRQKRSYNDLQNAHHVVKNENRNLKEKLLLTAESFKEEIIQREKVIKHLVDKLAMSTRLTATEVWSEVDGIK